MKIGSFADVKRLDQLVRDYNAVLTAVDENVGKVLGILDSKGLVDQTVVVYTSDNGFFLGEWNFFDKRLMYEPSIRIPLVVRYPRLIKPGTIRGEMALNIDLAPTLLELAGVETPADVQGKSLVPLAEGKRVAWRDAFLYEYFEYPEPHRVPPHHGVRTADWKLMAFDRDASERELYDLKNDPNETTNLYGKPEFAAKARELEAKLLELRRETGDLD